MNCHLNTDSILLGAAQTSGQSRLDQAQTHSIKIMLTPKHRPGQNIRQLARQRRAEAVRSFMGALTIGTFLVISTIYLAALPIYVYAIGTFSIVLFIVAGRDAWQRANRADQGAKGEEDVGRDLDSLQRSGWSIEYGRRLRFVGDIDIICRSPKGQVFAIDVKSHKGTVVYDRGQLRRRYGKTQSSFEKNFLDQVKRQAAQLKEADDYRYVTPVIAFSKAKVDVPGGKVEGVYVVARQNLRALLLNQG